MLRQCIVLLLLPTLFWTFSSSAAVHRAPTDVFGVRIVNLNFAPDIKMVCNDASVVIPSHHVAHLSIKFFYDLDHYLKPTCSFSRGSDSLGSISFRLIVDRRDGDIHNGYIMHNNLKKRYSEVTHTHNHIGIYFRDHE